MVFNVGIKKIVGLIFCLFISVGLLNAQHLKKDGTPDHRYKENRTTYSSPSKSSTYHYSGSHTSKSSSYSTKSGKHNSNYNYSVKRDTHGRIMRSESAKRDFMKQTGYPHGRNGYVVDHIIPLKKGGCDCPSNMQWQTKQAAKAKDKWE